MNDQMYVCPECGSASVDFSGLVGGVAECRVCKWVGKREQLLSVPFDNRMGSPVETMLAMNNDLRRAFSSGAANFIRFLIKWGFVPAVQRGENIEVSNKKLAIRYMNVISRATLIAIFDERQKIDKERANGS